MCWKTAVVLVISVLTTGYRSENETTFMPSLKDVTEQSGICRVCTCEDSKVNCVNKNITKFFSLQEWKDLTKIKPKEVDLSQNLFLNVTDIAELPIETLNLSRCKIEIIDRGSLRDLQNMKVLNLSHNKLTTENLSPRAFQGRYSPEQYEPLHLLTLNLAYNELHSLHQDLFEHVPQLEVLDLSGNPLKTINIRTLIAVSSLPMLKVFSLRSCGFENIPEKFLHTPRFLERLDISDNRLTTVPQAVKDSKNLVYLNLNNNSIIELDMESLEYPGFPKLRKLQELHMCNMPTLKRIGSGALAGLENIQRLHISNNPNLSFIHHKALVKPDDITENKPLVKELYLNSNNLSEVDSRLLSRWDLLDKVDVSYNPYLCDCSTQWMISSLVSIVDSRGGNSYLMVCKNPVEMKGYTMKYLHDTRRRMHCRMEFESRPVNISEPENDYYAIIYYLIIGVFLAVPLVLGSVLLWRHGYCAWLGLRGPTEESHHFYKHAPIDEYTAI